MDLVEKALNTNGCKILELAEPDFNPVIIGQKIDELDKEIVKMQKIYLILGLEPDLVTVLQAKILLRDTLICNLKSLKLLNDEPRRNNKGQNSNPTDTD